MPVLKPIERVEWESTPIGAMIVELREEPESFSKSGVAWRAYRLEGGQRYALGIGEETKTLAVKRVLAAYPQAFIEVRR